MADDGRGYEIEEYWNHNTAFHEELVADAQTRGGRVLDIGCGDGLLLQRPAPFVQKVVGIDPDTEAILRAQTRLAGVSNVSLETGDFLTARGNHPTPILLPIFVIMEQANAKLTGDDCSIVTDLQTSIQ